MMSCYGGIGWTYIDKSRSNNPVAGSSSNRAVNKKVEYIENLNFSKHQGQS